MLTEGSPLPESAYVERSAWADFAFLALSVSDARAVRLEARGETIHAGGLEEGVPTVVVPLKKGRLLIFDGVRTVAIDALARRIDAHFAAEERDVEHTAARALADRANDIARSAARRFETLFEGLPIACYACDVEGRLMEWNRAAEETWPTLAAAWGEEAAPLVNPDEPEAERASLQRALKGEPVRAEERETRTGDETRWHLIFAFPLHDADESIVGAIVARLDITRRRAAQHEVADREARLRTVIETLDEGLTVLDESGHVVLRNGSAERILRLASGPIELARAYPEGTVVDGDGVELPPERRPIIVALRTGKSARNVRLGLLRPGETERIWVRVNAQPLLRPSDGTPMGAVATFREEITNPAEGA